MIGRMDLINVDLLGWWLCERQLPSGGLNGRPEKLPDVCYSWWVLASLKMIGRLHWIDADKLRLYILACQVTQAKIVLFLYSVAGGGGGGIKMKKE